MTGKIYGDIGDSPERFTVFFHAETARYARRAVYLLSAGLLPLLMASVIVTIILVINFRALYAEPVFFYAAAGIAGAAALGLSFSCIVLQKTGKKARRAARYTYIDIGLHELVYSCYSGEHLYTGRRVIRRTLYVVPLASLEQLHTDTRGRLTLKSGEIRRYTRESDKLGYHFKGGRLDFDQWWNNVGGYETAHELVIPAVFEKQRELARSIALAQKRLATLPAPRPYVHKNPVIVRRKPRTSRWD